VVDDRSVGAPRRATTGSATLGGDRHDTLRRVGRTRAKPPAPVVHELPVGPRPQSADVADALDGEGVFAVTIEAFGVVAVVHEAFLTA
jgi:hypothetical protein